MAKYKFKKGNWSVPKYLKDKVKNEVKQNGDKEKTFGSQAKRKKS